MMDMSFLMFLVHSKERVTSDESSSIEAFQFKVFLLDALAKEDVALGGMENFPELLLLWLVRSVSKRLANCHSLLESIPM